MLNLEIGKREQLRVLCIGAHCDDIEIGCGGTMLKLLHQHSRLEVWWVIFCSTPERAKEARSSASAFLQGAHASTVLIREFRDGFLPYLGGQVKDIFEELKPQFTPDLIFTHHQDDLHQDHRLLSELTWNTYRDHFILEYEIPKFDGDLGRANVFSPLSRLEMDKKVDFVMKGFPSQRNKHWFSPDLFYGLARLRGMESVAPEGFAEGFYGRKVVFGTNDRSPSHSRPPQEG
jgi:LmbE family N-acetylglucosaminyl deacetylase